MPKSRSGSTSGLDGDEAAAAEAAEAAAVSEKAVESPTEAIETPEEDASGGGDSSSMTASEVMAAAAAAASAAAASGGGNERRRSERVKREKPDYYDALDFESTGRRSERGLADGTRSSGSSKVRSK